MKVEITHPDKILFPRGKITKQEVVDYYAKVASKMLPHLRNRPLTMKRYPNGIKKEGFFQKSAPEGRPKWVKTHRIERKEGKPIEMVICNDKATLLWLANQNCITPHIWLSKIDKLDYPDRMVFDLDPPPRKGLDMVVEGALLLKEVLEQEYRLKPWVMSTGSRGVHVVVSTKRSRTFDETRALAREIAERLVEIDPKFFTIEARKEKRKGRLYIDIMRNSKGATVVAPYSLRPLDGAPVATPLTWKELKAKKFPLTMWDM